jgi:hypothetical protein
LNPFILYQMAEGIRNNIIRQAKRDVTFITQGGSILLLAQGCIPLLDQGNSFQGQ